MSILDDLLKSGVSTLGGTVGGLAKDIRTAITGKEAITAAEREKILENVAEMEKLSLQADMAINEGQMKLNEIEEGSGSLFRGGWRPAVGWICVCGLAYQFIVLPIFPWMVSIVSHTVYSFYPSLALLSHKVPPMPPLDMGTLLSLLMGLLGLGGMRTFEKIKGLK